jgi:hypothetical protein
MKLSFQAKIQPCKENEEGLKGFPFRGHCCFPDLADVEI